MITDRPESTRDDLPALAGSRILLAEDSKDSQLLISHILRKAGARVSIAENGRFAVEIFTAAALQGEPFDLVLMDIQMPEMDGYEATGQLRRLGCKHPIIALTANTSSGDREKCLAAGCSDFTSKPVNRKNLLTLLRRILFPGQE